MKEVVFLLSFTPNPRIKKRVSLLKTRYRVTIIYWKSEQAFLYGDIMPDVSGYPIEIKKNVGNPVARIISTNRFSKEALNLLNDLKPDCIYVQNLDMLRIACKYNKEKKRGAIIIDEIADIHPLLIDHQTTFVNKIIQFVLRREDRHCTPKADILVVTTKTFYDDYYQNFISKKKVVLIPNIPDTAIFEGYKHKEKTRFTIGFIGLIRFKEQMKMLVEAAKEADVNVFFAGSEMEEEASDISIKDISNQNNHVTYYGKYNYETDIKKLYEEADAIYSVYDTSQKDILLALPNKLYESVLCRLPIIVSKGTYLADIVNQWGVGVAVSPTDRNELTEVIRRLSGDKDYYQSIVEKCIRCRDKINIDKYNRIFLQHLESAFEKT